MCRELKLSVLCASVVGERNRTMFINPSPTLPKGKGEAFSLVALVTYIHVAVIQETHPRPFPKGRENPTRKVRIVFPNVQVSHKSFERRNLPSLWEGSGMGLEPK